jgi:hypothetical protein
VSAAELISTVGVTLLLAAYALERSGRLRVGACLHAVNAVGATTAAVGSALIPFLPFVILESCWALLSLRELFLSLRSTSTQR